MQVIVIMAGGSGERFWPLSRQHLPKQLLHLTRPERSLLAEAVERSTVLVGNRHVFIVTARHLVQAITDAELGLPPENILAEPCRRNTAGCLCYAAAAILARYSCDASSVTMGVLTADHRISETEPFLATVEAALAAAEAHPALVTIGIQPQRPDTGFGYIEIPANAEPVAGVSAEHPVYPVQQFREKPSHDDAVAFLASGRFFWNSGMFFWRLSTFLSEFEHTNPVFAKATMDLCQAVRENQETEVEKIFASLPDISIDFALMEGAGNVQVAPGRFAWDDVGSWDSLDRTLSRDSMGNVTVGEPVLIDTENSIVYNATGAETCAVAVVGVRDLVVVVAGDAVLVIPKARVQDVKRVVAELKKRNSSQL